MSGNVRMGRSFVYPLAQLVLERLTEGVPGDNEPTCSDGLVVGSLRRGAASVGDIELVIAAIDGPSAAVDASLLPPARDLFGENVRLEGRVRNLARLERTIEYWVRERWLWRDPAAQGERLIRLRCQDARAIPIELHIAFPSNFGNLCAIFTGDRDFSTMLVKKRQWGGLMPDDMEQDGGFLYKLALDFRDRNLVECPTEVQFFEAIGVPFVDPHSRYKANALGLARDLGRHRVAA